MVIRYDRTMLKILLTKLKEWIPSCCLLCNQRSNSGIDLCTGCLQQLPWLNRGCEQCAQPLNSEHASTRFCGACLCTPPAYDSTLAPFSYQDTMITLIAKLKFNKNLSVGRVLGELMARHIKTNTPSDMPSLLLPVPLHPKRLRQRGYNQAIIIAEHLSKQLKIPLNRTLCKKIRHTATQSRVDAKHRHANIDHAFEIASRNLPSHVAIIDDVMTTGATVNALSSALKHAGVAKISVWCCARTCRTDQKNL